MMMRNTKNNNEAEIIEQGKRKTRSLKHWPKHNTKTNKPRIAVMNWRFLLSYMVLLYSYFSLLLVVLVQASPPSIMKIDSKK